MNRKDSDKREVFQGHFCFSYVFDPIGGGFREIKDLVESKGYGLVGQATLDKGNTKTILEDFEDAQERWFKSVPHRIRNFNKELGKDVLRTTDVLIELVKADFVTAEEAARFGTLQ